VGKEILGHLIDSAASNHMRFVRGQLVSTLVTPGYDQEAWVALHRYRRLGWNWRFYYRVLKPVLDELNPKAPVYPALVAPDSSTGVKLAGSKDVEFLAREASGYLYIMAAKRQGDTTRVEFTGLPKGISTGEVLFEPPRSVAVAGGKFTDWFAPHDVHVYRFKMP
jgi:hypothetical protein